MHTFTWVKAQLQQIQLSDNGAAKGVRLRGNKHAVDDVHNPIAGVVIRLEHYSVVDLDRSLSRILDDHKTEILAFHGLELLAIRDILRVHSAGGNVVGEHILQLLNVLGVEEVVQNVLGQRRKGLVGRCKDGERTCAREGVD